MVLSPGRTVCEGSYEYNTRSFSGLTQEPLATFADA
jgi:hypothetical protein